jgi:hypothetical protein
MKLDSEFYCCICGESLEVNAEYGKDGIIFHISPCDTCIKDAESEVLIQEEQHLQGGLE